MVRRTSYPSEQLLLPDTDYVIEDCVLGDAGAIVTNSKVLVDKVKPLGYYGSDIKYHHIYIGIGTNKHYPIPIHLQECYKNLGFKKGDFPIAEEISATELSLPMYYGMTDEEINYVIDAINEYK